MERGKSEFRTLLNFTLLKRFEKINFETTPTTFSNKLHSNAFQECVRIVNISQDLDWFIAAAISYSPLEWKESCNLLL